jgi:cell division protein FtsA
MLYEENRNMKIEDREILEIITQEYLVDDSDEISPVGCICTRIEGRYKVIAGWPALKSNLYKCFEKVGCKVNGIFLSPIATASAVLSEEEKELGCMMVDFGAGTTSVAVYYKNILRHISVIPFGGDVISKDILDLKVSEQVAEKLKVRYGSAMEELVEDFNISIPAVGGKEGRMLSNKFLAGIIEARTEEILDYVCDQMEKSGLANCVDEIVITGGGSQLQHLTEKLKLRTGLDVRTGIPEQKVAPDMEEKYLKVEYAQLIGLLILAETTCIGEKSTTPNKKVKKQGKGVWGTLFDKFGEILEDSKI